MEKLNIDVGGRGLLEQRDCFVDIPPRTGFPRTSLPASHVHLYRSLTSPFRHNGERSELDVYEVDRRYPTILHITPVLTDNEM